MNRQKCVYVGDNPVRDVEGTRAAGYGMIDHLRRTGHPGQGTAQPASIKPDYIIREMKELLDIFPPRKE